MGNALPLSWLLDLSTLFFVKRSTVLWQVQQMLDNLKYLFFFDASVNHLHKLYFVPLLIRISVPSQDSTT